MNNNIVKISKNSLNLKNKIFKKIEELINILKRVNDDFLIELEYNDNKISTFTIYSNNITYTEMMYYENKYTIYVNEELLYETNNFENLKKEVKKYVDI